MKQEFWGRLGKLPTVGEHATGLDVSILRKPGFMTDVFRGWNEAGDIAIARLRRRALEMGCPEEKLAPGFQERVIEFTGSDETVDRMGDIIRVDGWMLDDFRKNPVFMPWHDYHAPPVGQALDVYVDEVKGTKAPKNKRKRLRFIVLFASEQENPLAETMFQLYKGGFMRATSVGFRPLKVFRPDDEEREKLGMGPFGVVFEEQELLELSGVSIPANPNALQEAGLVVDEENAKELGILADRAKDADPEFALALRSLVTPIRTTVDLARDSRSAGENHTVDLLELRKAFESVRTLIEGETLDKGLAPANVSNQTADKGEAWSAPTLGDFTDESWGDLTSAQKRRIAGHFAWADASPPSSFGQLKLPHHRASDGAIVWRGLIAAAARFNQSAIPNPDKPAVRRHLRAEYGRFDEEPPAVLQESVPGEALPPIYELMARETLEALDLQELFALTGEDAPDDLKRAEEDEAKAVRQGQIDAVIEEIRWLWDDQTLEARDAEDLPATDPAATDPPATDPEPVDPPGVPGPADTVTPEPEITEGDEPPVSEGDTDDPAPEPEPEPEPAPAPAADPPAADPAPATPEPVGASLAQVEPWVASTVQIVRGAVRSLLEVRRANQKNAELRHAVDLGLHTVLRELAELRQEVRDAIPERDLESAENLDAEELRTELEGLEKQAFTVQAFKFPKRIWKSAEAVKVFAESAGLVQNEPKDKGEFFELMQREPKVFASTRDVCMSPGGADVAGGTCRIIATGGELKSAELLALEGITERLTQLEDRVTRSTNGPRLDTAPKRQNGGAGGQGSDLYAHVLDVTRQLRTKATGASRAPKED